MKKLICANDVGCNDCIYHPYCNKQQPDINWDKVEPGTLIYVKNNPNDRWLKRCFVEYVEPMIQVKYEGNFWLYRFAKLMEDNNEV